MSLKNKSIVHDLCTLQIGVGRRNVHRIYGRILKKIVCSTKRNSQETKKFQCSGPSLFTLLHCGRLLHHENRKTVKCYSSYEKEPKQLYSFHYVHQCKDLIVWSPDSPHSTSVLLSQGERHSTSLLYLVSTPQNQSLVRRCALTGRMHENVCLASSERLKFTELQCDPETDIIVLKSIKNTNSEHNFITLAIFSSPPLQFIAMFEVSKLVFGRKMLDAGVQQGVLFVRHSDDRVKLYSLEYILSKYCDRKFRLGDVLENGNVLGKSLEGLPITLQIAEEPPVLMEVNSHQGDFIIGGNPWHYIIKPGQYNSHLHHLGNNNIVARIHTPDTDMETEHVFFHPDESNRLIHISNHFMKISWIQEKCLLPWVKYPPEGLPKCLPAVNTQPRVSRYGRNLKPTSSSQSSVAADQEDVSQDLCMAYDIQTDIIGVLKVSEGELGENLTLDQVTLFDNESGEMIRVIDLNKFSVNAAFDTSSFTLVLDGVQLLAATKYKDKTFGVLISLVENFY